MNPEQLSLPFPRVDEETLSKLKSPQRFSDFNPAPSRKGELSEDLIFSAMGKPGNFEWIGSFRRFNGSLGFIDYSVAISSQKGWPTVDCIGFAIRPSYGADIQSAPIVCWERADRVGYAISPGGSPGRSNMQVIIDLGGEITDKTRETISELTQIGGLLYQQCTEGETKISRELAVRLVCRELAEICSQKGLPAVIRRGTIAKY